MEGGVERTDTYLELGEEKEGGEHLVHTVVTNVGPAQAIICITWEVHVVRKALHIPVARTKVSGQQTTRS
jgi:hypothetical protein